MTYNATSDTYFCRLEACANPANATQLKKSDWSTYCTDYESSFQAACPLLTECSCAEYVFDNTPDNGLYNQTCQCPTWYDINFNSTLF